MDYVKEVCLRSKELGVLLVEDWTLVENLSM